MKFPWLEYSPSKDSVFCFYCRALPSASCEWYTYFKRVERNDLFSEPVRPAESVIDNLVDI